MIFKARAFLYLFGLILASSFFNQSLAQGMPDPSKIQIEAFKVTDNIYMLKGMGGNVGIFIDDDSIIMIDSQFAPMAPKLEAAITELSSKPIGLLINTHWHGDHTSGNAFFGKQGVPILGHDNVYNRLSSENISAMNGQKVPPFPQEAWPTMTFSQSMTLRADNGEKIVLSHVKNANTDSDSIIHFKESNVIHAGDAYFQGAYPLVDNYTGSSINGLIDAAQTILALSDEQTKIIPGHGKVVGIADIKKDMQMLIDVRDKIQTLIDQNKTLEQVKAAKPSSEHDAEYGQSFIKPDSFVTAIYVDLTE